MESYIIYITTIRVLHWSDMFETWNNSFQPVLSPPNKYPFTKATKSRDNHLNI